MAKARLFLKASAAHAIRAGHPWVFRESVARTEGAYAVGDPVQIYEGPELLGTALADPTSPLLARMWTHDARELSPALFRERLTAALRLRARLFETTGEAATTAYRLLNGEGDRTPGIVVDVYGACAVVRTDGSAAGQFFKTVEEDLWQALSALKAPVRTLLCEGELLRGEACTRVEVREHGMPFWVDLQSGQKTGAFLDQRENRRRVRGMSNNQRVLNLFSYAGGFSVAAALGGASHTTSVDSAPKAHTTAMDSFKLAGVDPSPHAFVTADAFEFLKNAAARKQSWDIVISDPPSFAPNEKSKARAIAAYRKLHAACVSVLREGGTFCAASCSSHITQEDFLSTLDARVLEHRNLKLVSAFGPPEDHPTLPEFPEGRYLKFMVLA
jgi:23S rRNA (cytosine1962-C5)-methyltransferase